MEPDEDNSLDIRILDPAKVRIFRTDGDSRIRATLAGDRSYTSVRIACAFPFNDPGHYIGLRDRVDNEIGLIVDPERLEKPSQDVISTELERRYFMPKVEKVVSVKEEHGTVVWQLETDRGPRRLVVRNIRDNAFSLGPDRLILTDPEGNRVEFSNIERYGRKAYEVLAKVI